MRFVGMTAKDSAKLAIDAAMIFRAQARIPTREIHKCTQKLLLKLYTDWKDIQKTVPEKRSARQKQVAEEYGGGLEDLFDIAHADALNTMKNEEDKAFLVMQRQKGRPGCMAGIDMVLYAREKRSKERCEKEQTRKWRQQEMSEASGTCFEPNFLLTCHLSLSFHTLQLSLHQRTHNKPLNDSTDATRKSSETS